MVAVSKSTSLVEAAEVEAKKSPRPKAEALRRSYK